MPELPEVETISRGLNKQIKHNVVTKVIVRHYGLRLPIDKKIAKTLPHHKIEAIKRRGKYLLLIFKKGTLIFHLGMSGNLRVVSPHTPIQKHDHVDIVLSGQKILRYNDPRRFGLMVWTEDDADKHPLLAKHGFEPFSQDLTAEYLFKQSRKRAITAKQFLMDHKIVVGIGNIYASEILFLSAIHPLTPAKKINLHEFTRIVQNIHHVLKKAIMAGGTTLKDFTKSDGKPGYFKQQLLVYDQEGQPCTTCKTLIKKIIIAQRSTYFCPTCQKK